MDCSWFLCLIGMYGNQVMVHLPENKKRRSCFQPRERDLQFCFRHHGERPGLSKYGVWVIPLDMMSFCDVVYTIQIISNDCWLWHFVFHGMLQIKRLHLLLTERESAMDVPENLEARRRIAFFTNSLFMDMPRAPRVRNMLSFRCTATMIITDTEVLLWFSSMCSLLFGMLFMESQCWVCAVSWLRTTRRMWCIREMIWWLRMRMAFLSYSTFRKSTQVCIKRVLSVQSLLTADDLSPSDWLPSKVSLSVVALRCTCGLGWWKDNAWVLRISYNSEHLEILHICRWMEQLFGAS